jgi:hypothetical protein
MAKSDVAGRISWFDRVRIERVLWTLDTYLQSLPAKARRGIRREMRANLRAAAAQSGAKEAVRGLGSLRQLAIGYLEAAYDDGPRPRLLRAFGWTLLAELVVLTIVFAAHSGFVDGIEAGAARPDGTFVWDTWSVVGVEGEVTFADGRRDAEGISFTPLVLVLPLLVFLVSARIWRLPRSVRRSRGAVADVERADL